MSQEWHTYYSVTMLRATKMVMKQTKQWSYLYYLIFRTNGAFTYERLIISLLAPSTFFLPFISMRKLLLASVHIFNSFKKMFISFLKNLLGIKDQFFKENINTSFLESLN